MTTATRTDIHRPSFLDPAEYTEIGYFDLHHEDGFCWISPEYRNLDAQEFNGNFTNKGRCDHCGAGPLRYGVIFLHVPSNTIVNVGERCAGVLGLSSKTEKARRDEHAAAQKRIALETWLAADPKNTETYEFLTGQIDAGRFGFNGFYFDLLHKLNRYGSLSEKQVDAALRGRDRDAEFEARKVAEKPASPLVEGRYEITGEIVSTKSQESDYGWTWKMLVKMEDGNKVWGTIPESLFCLDVANAKGERVTFTATVERSRDDENFGFFKRPTKATVVS